MLVLCDTGSSIPLRDRSVHCVVTSPPYWALRDYGDPRQIGLEPTPDAYVARMVAVFREVRRVLRDDGTLWLNLGDSYSGSGPSGASYQSETTKRREAGDGHDGTFRVSKTLKARGLTYAEKKPIPPPGLKPKDLIGIPWRVALALQSDGWYLRSDCIWAKPNPMPESVTDRPTKSHEYVFLLTKRGRYYYDAAAERTPHVRLWEPETNGRGLYGASEARPNKHNDLPVLPHPDGANLRTVWNISTRSYPGAHFATFTPELPARCIRLGTSERGCCPACGAPHRRVTAKERRPTRPGVGSKAVGLDAQVIGNRDPSRHVTSTRTIGWEPGCGCDAGDPVPCVVLDPFSGSGTTVVIARELGRVGVGLDVSRDYMGLAVSRIREGIMVRRRKPKRPASPSRGGIQFTLFD